MAWYDTVKSWFTPESTMPEYWEFETPPPITAYPKPEYWEFETPPVYKDSLWDNFKSTVTGVYQEAKEIAPDVASFYTKMQEITKPVDPYSLAAREPQPMEIPKTNYLMSTPYQRSTSGTQPTTASFVSGAGLSMPLLLVGAGLIFLMLKKR